jgi:V/A-type H+-transporting ATPase subunit I
MIVPMKKVTLLSLISSEQETLEKLRNLGVMQVTFTGKILDDTREFEENLLSDRQVFQELENIRKADTAFSGSPLEGDVLALAKTFIEEKNALQSRVDALNQRLKVLAPWGNFDKDLLDNLANKGIIVHLCCASKKEYLKASKLENCTCVLISVVSGRCNFAVIHTSEVEVDNLPEIKLLAEDNPLLLNKELDEKSKQICELDFKLKRAALSLSDIKDNLLNSIEKLEFLQVRDSSLDFEDLPVRALQGFVPADEIENLKVAAKENAWGLWISNPSDSDNVPVLIKESKFAKLVKPLFDFLGVLPGYKELDASGSILVFFTIFYALIIGDAGYGILFLLASILGLIFTKNKPKIRLPLKFFALLSLATTIWGVASGNYFGISWGGLKCLTDASVKDANVQAFCFLLAVCQLSLGHLWRAIHEGSWKSAGGNLGWTLIIWGNFFLTLKIIVWPGQLPVLSYWLYGIGAVLVFICAVDWKNPAAIFQLPFDFIGSFTDVLSYIRLFAVGMAGVAIAQSFNGMAMDVMKASPWFIIFGILIIIFGHILNLALGFMGVLVHAVRLNTLEFSNHSSLTWSGSKFKPFKKLEKDNE